MCVCIYIYIYICTYIVTDCSLRGVSSEGRRGECEPGAAREDEHSLQRAGPPTAGLMILLLLLLLPPLLLLLLLLLINKIIAGSVGSLAAARVREPSRLQPRFGHIHMHITYTYYILHITYYILHITYYRLLGDPRPPKAQRSRAYAICHIICHVIDSIIYRINIILNIS